jgi:ankyrin repeat protein
MKLTMDLNYLLNALKKDDVESFISELNGKYDEVFQIIKYEEKLTPLIFAVRYNAVNIFNKLIDFSIDINATGEFNWTPLLEAISNRNLYFTKRLIELGADIEQLGGKATVWPLTEALISGNIEILQCVLSKASKEYIEWGLANVIGLNLEYENEVCSLLIEKLNR